MFFNEDHLKITKIRTNNGTTPVYDEQGRPMKKIVFAPKNKTTLKLFEDQNTRLPNHLKMTLESIKAYDPQATAGNETDLLRKQIAALQEENEKLKSEGMLKVSATDDGGDGSNDISEAVVKTQKTSK